MNAWRPVARTVVQSTLRSRFAPRAKFSCHEVSVKCPALKGCANRNGIAVMGQGGARVGGPALDCQGVGLSDSSMVVGDLRANAATLRLEDIHQDIAPRTAAAGRSRSPRRIDTSPLAPYTRSPDKSGVVRISTQQPEPAFWATETIYGSGRNRYLHDRTILRFISTVL